MFGQHDDQGGMSQPQDQNNGFAEPTADGMLGSSVTSDAAMSTDGGPAQTSTDVPMPSPFHQTASDNGTSLPNPATPSAPAADDLISIKQDALQQLKPLVGHLNQAPEEKFRTTMMMIQAADDQGLIPDAYEAAKAIQDEKTRAQALLDVVNEINYFTTQHTEDGQQ